MQTEPAPSTQQATDAHPSESGLGFNNVLTSFRRWWGKDVIATVDQVAVIEKRRAECGLSARYLLLTCMSAGIAIIGLLQGSVAVVIGAMLLSPLMDPIMSVGFSLAIGDFQWLRQAGKSLAIGVLFAVLFTALVVFISPMQNITAEIAARTRPNLFDLAVAFFSSVAGAYAMIKGREGTIVGVAIATALMPPLAVIGFGLATLNATVFWGALFLFVTNLTAIALTATAMARLYGFSTSLSDKQSQMQVGLIFFAFVLLAIPLFLSLRQIVWESQATRQANNVVVEVFDGNATVSVLEPNFDVSPMQVTATVLTPNIIGDAERRAAEEMSRELGRPVEVSLTQLRVGTSSQAQEEAQLAQASAQEAAARERAQDIAERLSLIAGVPVEDVTLDRERRRALVTANPLEGATLAAYRELEQRINTMEPDWDIRLTPPVRSLPDITFEAAPPAEGGEEADPPFVLSAEGQRAVNLAVWAHGRIGIPITITGPDESLSALRTVLSTHEISANEVSRGSGYGTVSVDWSTGE